MEHVNFQLHPGLSLTHAIKLAILFTLLLLLLLLMHGKDTTELLDPDVQSQWLHFRVMGAGQQQYYSKASHLGKK